MDVIGSNQHFRWEQLLGTAKEGCSSGRSSREDLISSNRCRSPLTKASKDEVAESNQKLAWGRRRDPIRSVDNGDGGIWR